MPRSNARRLRRRCGKQIAYAEIRQILRTRRLLILVCDDKTGVLVARKGTEEEVIALLRGAKDKE